MIKRYYTPTIEEFHPGFEYEHFEDFDVHPEKTWHKQTYGIDGADQERVDYVSSFGIKEGLIRVKHLDREDIESCGWETTVKSGKEVLMYEILVDDFRGRRRTTLRMVHNSISNWVAIAMVDEKFNMMGEQDEKAIFSGEIKNKSEFKRILKQVGIC